MKLFSSLVLAAIAALAVLSSRAVAAETKPLVDKDRVSLAAGVGFSWYASSDVPEHSKEAEASLNPAYAVTEHLSLAAPGTVGFDNRRVRFSPGVHYRIDPGNGLALGIAYDMFGGDNLPSFRHEWNASAIYARALSPTVVVGLVERLGLDSHTLTTEIGVRFVLAKGRNS